MIITFKKYELLIGAVIEHGRSIFFTRNELLSLEKYKKIIQEMNWEKEGIYYYLENHSDATLQGKVRINLINQMQAERQVRH
jgi:hypothetical protein